MCCLQFLDGIFINETLWCVDKNTHVLFGVDIRTKAIACSVSLEDYIVPSNEPRKIFTDGEKIYITLLYGATVLRVDSNNLKVETITCLEGENVRMMNAVLNKSYIYLLPRTMKGDAYIYDLKNNDISKVAIPNISEDVHIVNAATKDEILYGIVVGTNMVLELDLETFAHSIHVLDIETKLVDISVGNDGFFFLGNDRIIKCSKNFDIYQNLEIKKAGGRYSHIIDVGEYIVLVPCDKMDLYRCSKNNMCMEKIEARGDTGVRTDLGSLFFGYKFHNGKVFLFPWTSNVLLEWDVENAFAETHALMYGGEFRIIKEKTSSIKMLSENENAFEGLDVYLQRVKNIKTQTNKISKDILIGEKIYDNICRRIK